MLGFPKAAVVNFVVNYVKKLVPDYRINGAIRFREALAQGRKHSMPTLQIEPDDIAFLQYTGGTTGVAKGAMLTHRNLVANMQQAHQWVGGTGQLLEGQEVVITALPLYHIFALTANGLVFMKVGGCNHLISNPRDMPGFVKELKRPASPRSLASTRCSTACSIHPVSIRSIFLTQDDPGRRHGRAALGRRTLEEGHRPDPGRGVRPDRNLTGRLHQPDDPKGLQRLDRPADSVHRCLHQGRRRHGVGDRRDRRVVHQGPAGDEGLLEEGRRDRQGDGCRRLAAHWRHRPHGRARLRLHRRSQRT